VSHAQFDFGLLEGLLNPETLNLHAVGPLP
jgi:hypothetical protein